MMLAQVAYEAYCKATGGKSLISGSPLPAWSAQAEAVKAAWLAAATAVVAEHDRLTVQEEDGDDLDTDEPVAAIEQCDRILGMCEELPGSSENFCSSVEEKVRSIRDWIEKNSTVTDAQQTALDNMESGVSRWLD